MSNTEDAKLDAEFRQNRREFIKTKIRFLLLESLVVRQEFPSDLKRRPDVIRRLTEDLILGPTSSAKSKPKLEKAVVEIINAHLTKLLLVSGLLCHWPPSSTETRNEYLRAAMLPDLVRTDLALIRASSGQNFEENSCIPVLVKHHDVLSSLGNNYCLGTVLTENNAKLEYNVARSQTLDAKLNCIKQEILAQTYTTKVTEALSKIRSEILLQFGDVRDEIERTKAELMAYKSIGPELEAIVEKFSEVQKAVENEKWAVSEFMR